MPSTMPAEQARTKPGNILCHSGGKIPDTQLLPCYRWPVPIQGWVRMAVRQGAKGGLLDGRRHKMANGKWQGGWGRKHRGPEGKVGS